MNRPGILSLLLHLGWHCPGSLWNIANEIMQGNGNGNAMQRLSQYARQPSLNGADATTRQPQTHLSVCVALAPLLDCLSRSVWLAGSVSNASHHATTV